MNGRTTIPTKAWKAEAAQLDAERSTLYSEYLRLRGQVKEAEIIRRCVEQAVREEPQARRDREQGMEL